MTLSCLACLSGIVYCALWSVAITV